MEPVELRETSLALHAHLEPAYLWGEGQQRYHCVKREKGQESHDTSFSRQVPHLAL